MLRVLSCLIIGSIVLWIPPISQAQSEFNYSDSNEENYQVQYKKRKRSKRRRRPSSKKRKGRFRAYNNDTLIRRKVRRRKSLVRTGIKAGLGLVIPDGDGTPLFLSGDYETGLNVLWNKAPSGLSIVGGLSFWSIGANSGGFSSSATIITFQAGSDYHYPATPDLNVFGGARISMAFVRVDTSGGTSGNENLFFLSPVLGTQYDIGPGSVGAELRYPLASKIKAFYLLATYKFHF